MATTTAKYYKRDFWSKENLKYVEPHFRLSKAARIVNQLARGRECDLLDVGCGPATLAKLLDRNIHYYGIDIAIHNPAPNLLQADFAENPIAFGGRRFDLIVATNIFIYYDVFEQSLCLRNVETMLRRGGFLLTNNALLELPSSGVHSVDYLTVVYSDRPDDGDHIVWYQRAAD